MSSSPTKPFSLYTAGTPNGFQASIVLEELKALYPAINYEAHKIDIGKLTQKEPWFIKINPNGRIPVLVDPNRDNFAVFETAAILFYLVQNYDNGHKLWFNPTTNPNEYSELLQWTFWAHGGLAPIQGQSNHFQRFAPEDVPYAKKRFLDEVKRVFGVLEIRLKDRDYLVGPGRGVFTIADIKSFPWVNIHAFSGIESLDEWPNVKAWLKRCVDRPAAQAGLQVGKL